jgi:hypothetical protein
MKPVLPGHSMFSPIQSIDCSVFMADTMFTVLSKGMVYRPGAAGPEFGQGINLATASAAALNSHFASQVTPGLKDGAGAEVEGRIPVIHDYWGTGAPMGVPTPNRVAIRILGQVKATCNAALLFTGTGTLRVFHNGVAVPHLTPTGGSGDSFRTFIAGDQVELFYWALDQEWGGWSIRVIDSSIRGDGVLGWDTIRTAPVLSASWMDDGTAVALVPVLSVAKARIECREGQVRTATIELAQTEPGSFDGWYFNPAAHTAVHNATGTVLKEGHYIRVTDTLGIHETVEHTGFIHSMVPGSGGTITLTVLGFEARLNRQQSENYPDRLSYTAFGYTATRTVEDPAFGVPAYDHWPYEYAITDLLLRAWVDPSLLLDKKRVLRAGQSVPENGAPLFVCRSPNGALIRIPRQPNYGNPFSDPDLPVDDDYLTTSDANKSIYARVGELVERIGYHFGTDHFGSFTLRPRNSPDALQPLYTFSAGADSINPAALGGKYKKIIGTGWNHAVSGIKAARLELVVGVVPGGGTIQITVVRQEDNATFTKQVSLARSTEAFFYDDVRDGDFWNVCVIPVLTGAEYGTYTVTITPLGGNSSTEYRLNAIRAYEQDPLLPHPAFSLRSFQNLLELDPRSNSDDRLNDAIVVGGRSATITDSEKVQGSPEREFIVRRAQDIHSILNPLALNYIGGRITAVLSDEALSDHSLADWAALSLVSRYRVTRMDGVLKHTLLPVVELGDVVYAKDDRVNNFDGTVALYVVGITHDYDMGRATALTNLEVSVFPSTPSYEPNEEVDISAFNNKPVINLSIQYRGVNGTLQANPGVNRVVPVTSADRPSLPLPVYSDAGGLYLTIPNETWSPDTELLSIITTVGNASAIDRVKNFPYYKYYRRTGTRLDIFPTVSGRYMGGDGTSAYGPYPNPSSRSAVLTYVRIQDAYTGNSPFYDPYLSERTPSDLVEVAFDTLVSGYYRVSLVDARGTELPIAWLTNPSVQDPDPNQHWAYFTPGVGRTFRWDGVDTIGTWNRKQTSDNTSRTKNLFPDISETYRIGAGVYAQNDNTVVSPVHISGEVVNSQPVYPVGKYSQFYVRIECRRVTQDTLLTVRSDHGSDTKTSALGHLFNSSAAELPARYVYYHLPPLPNRVAVSISDWSGAGAYVPGGTSWSTSPDTNATFRDSKPVRISLTPQPRPGARFAGQDIALKVNRVVHMMALSMDSSLVSEGKLWNDKGESERKRVISRRTVNDEHTLIYRDADFVRGSTLSPWVFQPSQFEDDFGDGTEPVRYMNYLQFFEVPHWNPARRSGEMRSRFLMGFMAYLFYFSVFTQDRSGRLAWAIDPTHVDRSKILYNNEPMSWPFDLDRHQRRVIYTRQWWDTDALNTSLAEHSVPQAYRGTFADRLSLFDTTSSHVLYPLNNGTTVTGSWSTGIADRYLNLLKSGESRLPSAADHNRAWGTASTSVLGSWTWNPAGEPFVYVPAPSRDFHPFYCVPPMALCSRREPKTDDVYPGYTAHQRRTYWEKSYTLAHVKQSRPGKIGDEASADTWVGMIQSETVGGSLFLFYIAGEGVDYRYTEQPNKPTAVPESVADHQRIDEFPRYEDSRGGMTNDALAARDPRMVLGGSHYYLNPVMYKWFHEFNWTRKQWANDIVEQEAFSLTFRHTYVWESPSLFPVDRSFNRPFKPELLDGDLTGVTSRPDAFDPGAWVGWKDDHPSQLQAVEAFKDSGTCSQLHWYQNSKARYTPGIGGGVCETADINDLLEDSLKPMSSSSVLVGTQLQAFGRSFDTRDTAWTVQPMAVGPRLPETRRVLFGLVLLGNRRSSAG